MTRKPTCVNCNQEMQTGFIPDLSQTGSSAMQLSWHPGLPEDFKVLGMKTGGVRYDKASMKEIIAFRCPSCGLVLPFAR